jgi:hypothetical protein
VSRSRAFFYSRKQVLRVCTDSLLPTAAITNTPTRRIAAPPMRARKFYTRIKKDESPDTDVGTENIRQKGGCDRRSNSRRIVAGQTATRANKPATTPYLAINWQRGCINTRFTSRDRRFPTPLQWRNTTAVGSENGSAVTTRHLFRPNQRRKAASLLPIWLRNSDVVGRRSDREAERGGRRGSPARSRQDALIHKLTWNFIANGSLPCSAASKKNAGPQPRHPTSALPPNTVP